MCIIHRKYLSTYLWPPWWQSSLIGLVYLLTSRCCSGSQHGSQFMWVRGSPLPRTKLPVRRQLEPLRAEGAIATRTWVGRHRQLLQSPHVMLRGRFSRQVQYPREARREYASRSWTRRSKYCGKFVHEPPPLFSEPARSP
ncbi:hypothetical protein B0T18DRAFT_410943, partial [Schizothecium vesticola]